MGVRFGAAFRKWKADKSSKKVNDDCQAEVSSKSHSKQRPHSRRAHWSHYWYGHKEEKVRRPKWINAYFVNMQDTSDSPAVIHRVDANKQQ